MKIAIVGAGAAGLMAAATLTEFHPEAEIILLEKNDAIGKKVIISGGGRCNVTTGIRVVREVLQRYPRGQKFLSSALHQFSPEAVYDWFEAHGVPLKTEEDLRVFPQSDNGRDIVGVFERLFQRANVRVWLKANVIRLEKRGEAFALFLKDQEQDPLLVDRVLLTTGGQAYRHTGSTGDGYAFAQAMGHTITPLAPSLNAFFTKEVWPKELAGLSFEKVTVTALRPSEPAYTGPILFTHKGVTGPAVFALSSLVAFEIYDAQRPLDIAIDLFPEQSPTQVLARLEQLIKEAPRKDLSNVLARLVPKSLADVVIQQHAIPPKHAAEISKQTLTTLISWLKRIPLTVIARGAGDEFVTAGGVSLKEVNPSTMESTLCPGLFFAGEILDIDGFTGGFNLQASWSAGRLAGLHVGEYR